MNQSRPFVLIAEAQRCRTSTTETGRSGLDVWRWVKGHPKLTITILVLFSTMAWGSVSFVVRTAKAVEETLPEAVQVLNDHDRALIRMETELDMVRETAEENAEVLEAIPQIQTDIRWIREALSN